MHWTTTWPATPPDSTAATFTNGVVLRASGGPSILKELSNEQIAIDVEDAARLNVSAMAVQVFVGGEPETQSIRNMTQLVDAGLRYGIATLVRERTDGQLAIEDAALYQALHRLDRQGLVDAEWRASENNRRARYYTLTPDGRKRLREETANWRRYARAVALLLEGA